MNPRRAVTRSPTSPIQSPIQSRIHRTPTTRGRRPKRVACDLDEHPRESRTPYNLISIAIACLFAAVLGLGYFAYSLLQSLSDIS